MLRLGNRVLVTRHADVVEILRRDEDFTIAEINAARMEQWSGAFILGMDRGPEYEYEKSILRQAVRPDDMPRIRQTVADATAELVERARPSGRIDAVGGFARVVPTRLVASYFGVPGPDEPTTMRWMRALFDAVFLDDGSRARETAAGVVAEQRPYMEALIARRRADLAAGQPVPDDVLTRLVAAWSDDGTVRRNLNGLIVGAVDTTSKSVAHALDELLRQPKWLAVGQAAALAGDIDTVRQCVYEALRFRPHQPIVVRHCQHDTRLGPRGRRIRAGQVVMAAGLSASFDRRAVSEPRQFRMDRSIDEYLHFGHGLHTCFGRQINFVQLPELVAALLRLPGLRRARGAAGRLAYDGPFPDRLILEFNS
jgi:cytochrome P450